MRPTQDLRPGLFIYRLFGAGTQEPQGKQYSATILRHVDTQKPVDRRADRDVDTQRFTPVRLGQQPTTNSQRRLRTSDARLRVSRLRARQTPLSCACPVPKPLP